MGISLDSLPGPSKLEEPPLCQVALTKTMKNQSMIWTFTSQNNIIFRTLVKYIERMEQNLKHQAPDLFFNWFI